MRQTVHSFGDVLLIGYRSQKGTLERHITKRFWAQRRPRRNPGDLSHSVNSQCAQASQIGSDTPPLPPKHWGQGSTGAPPLPPLRPSWRLPFRHGSPYIPHILQNHEWPWPPPRSAAAGPKTGAGGGPWNCSFTRMIVGCEPIFTLKRHPLQTKHPSIHPSGSSI